MSAFACRTHSDNTRFDVVSVHGNPPAQAGVFWGLHPEIAGDLATRTNACLAVLVEPNANPPGNAMIRLYHLAMDCTPGSNRFSSTHLLAKAALDLNWAKPVRLDFRIAAGKLGELLVQGHRVRLPPPKAAVAWPEFARGQCGLLTARDRVVFTHALLHP
jgi:hypothetical protein